MLANIGIFELQTVEIIDTTIELFPEQIIPPSDPELAEETVPPVPSTDPGICFAILHLKIQDNGREWTSVPQGQFSSI